jgi:hypothetical protein
VVGHPTQAEAAWSQLEVVTVVVPVKQDEVGFIIGKKGQQVHPTHT